jgi:nitrite reductase (NADH) small subunit
MEATMAWVEVARLAGIPHLGSRVVATALGDIALFRGAGDNVFPLDDKRPHKGGPLSQGIVHGHAVTCPLHSKGVDLDGGEAQAHDSGCIRRRPAKLEAGRVPLALPA